MLRRAATGIGASKTTIRPGLVLDGERACTNQGALRIVIPKYFYPQPDCQNFKNVVKKFGNKKLMPIFAVPIAEIAQLVEHDLAKVGVASSSLVFRSKGQFSTDLFLCPDHCAFPRTRGPVLPPLEGRGGYKKGACPRRRRGFESRFPL